MPRLAVDMNDPVITMEQLASEFGKRTLIDKIIRYERRIGAHEDLKQKVEQLGAPQGLVTNAESLVRAGFQELAMLFNGSQLYRNGRVFAWMYKHAQLCQRASIHDRWRSEFDATIMELLNTEDSVDAAYECMEEEYRTAFEEKLRVPVKQIEDQATALYDVLFAETL